MRHQLFAALIGLGVTTGTAALAQQDLDLQDQTETDLGASVDDLLQNAPSRAQTPVIEEPANIEDELPQQKDVTDPDSSEEIDIIDLDDLVEEEPVATAVSYDQFQSATLRALDKITGRSTDIEVVTDTPIVFGSLNIEMKTCYQTPPELPPESVAFLSIKSTQAVQVETMDDAVAATDVSTVSDENPRLFSGWMFASSPGLSALEHPVYDVWVISCNASAPE